MNDIMVVPEERHYGRMANTYTQLNIHIVFTIKGKHNAMNYETRNIVFPYISGILKEINNFPLAVNGYIDHVHAFFELNPINSISEVARIIKSNSSKMLNDKRLFNHEFHWQTGYGAFSYSKSQRNNVIKYILNQENHHREKTFREEYLSLLYKFQIEFKNDYLFEFYEF